ncbi:MAG TPA: glycine cleavage system protein GcvH [Firmicutes bacterium]|nr:glycine cleavage system protein GcvH [Bacillota bacterium]
MAELDGYQVPDDLYYHKEHMWLRVEDNIGIVGITDFSQKLAGEISYIELPGEDEEVSRDQIVGTIETGKWMGKIFAPVSGKVIAINEDVEDSPEKINESPYVDGWLFKIEMSKPSEIETLYKGSAALEWLKGEIEKHAK